MRGDALAAFVIGKLHSGELDDEDIVILRDAIGDERERRGRRGPQESVLAESGSSVYWFAKRRGAEAF